jgi:uncharacterized protein (TIRG00374 family)
MSSRASRIRVVSTVFAFALAAVLLFLSLRGIDWRSVGRLFRQAQAGYVAIACASLSLSLFLRAYRSRILLRTAHQVRMRDAFWATSGGYFGNNFLPARAGEFIRAYMIHSCSGLSNTFVLTTILSERVADAITLVGASSLTLLLIPEHPGWLAHASRPFAVLGMAGVAAILLARRLSAAGDWLIDRIVRHWLAQERFAEKLHETLKHVVSGIQAFHHGPSLLAFGGMTGVIWAGDVAIAIIIAHSVNVTMSAPVALLLLAGLGLASGLPSTPGYVGIFQFVAVSVLVPFGMTRDQAIGFILMLQALQYLVVGLWGAVGVWKFRHLTDVPSAP